MGTTTLSIPHWQTGKSLVEVDLALAYEGENRLPDIALAGTVQAKELFSVFTKAYTQLARSHAALKFQTAKAAIASRKRRAILLLDVIPEKAAEKGLASARNKTGSEDVREAFFYSDDEFVRIEETRAALEAAEALVFGKLMAMKAAMDATRAMLAPGDVPSVNTMGTSPYPTDPAGQMVEKAIDNISQGGNPWL